MEFSFPRCQAIPGVDRASLQVDGREVVGFCFDPGQQRPFFFPIVGPSGRMLTRMGHPNPVGHEHHKSVWFGHLDVGGENFWADRPGKDVRIRVREVSWYEDGADWAALAADLDWYAEGRVRLSHRLIAAVEPVGADGGYALDLQSRFESPDGRPVALGKTNFGFLGVRMAKTISEQFGGGRLIDADGRAGEDSIFGQSSRWVDYSGPVAPGVVEGIAYFDHPDNPRHPTHWHVRRDGWMGAAPCLVEGTGVAVDHPLDLRYRLLVHAGPADPDALDDAWRRFADTPAFAFAPAEGGAFPSIRRGPSA